MHAENSLIKQKSPVCQNINGIVGHCDYVPERKVFYDWFY